MKMGSNRGITLVELVVSVSILAVIIVTAVTVLDFGRKSFFVLAKQGEIQTQASNIAATISSKVRQCRSINVSGESRLDIVEGDGGSISFYITGTSLLYSDLDTGESKVLSTMVEDVSFSKIKNGVVMEITLNDFKGQSYIIRTTAYGRF